MRRTVRSAAAALGLCACVAAQPATARQAAAPAVDQGLVAALDILRHGLDDVARLVSAGDPGGASRLGLRLYLDHYEVVEALYGRGGPRSSPVLSDLVTAGESEFHRLMGGGEASALAEVAGDLRRRMDGIERAAVAAGIPLGPVDEPFEVPAAIAAMAPAAARTAEIRWILERLEVARLAHADGRAADALAAVEEAYLEGFEPIEARLPGGSVRRIESLIHLQLRPRLARDAAASEVEPVFAALGLELASADDALGTGSAWFGTFNAFIIMVREGLEAVLLIGAILAYLKASGADPRHARRVYTGAALGVVASVGTWLVARSVLPVSGASRELLEGVTALVAVAVLLYVSHWLFQKTYIHDWKRFLRDHVGRAVSTGSALAMASLAFAAVYREGFETVLFYQALMFDTGAGAVLAGFIPGTLLVLVVGIAIVKLGLKLPLRTTFAVTNGILLYLAFVFLGKGLYNLQEAGLFSPLPVGWMPDSDALRQVMGLYPVAQTLLAQAAFLTALAVTWAAYRWRAAQPAPT